jgi:hypothetical protein
VGQGVAMKGWLVAKVVTRAGMQAGSSLRGRGLIHLGYWVREPEVGEAVTGLGVLVLAVVLAAAVKMMREMVGLVVEEAVQTAAQGIVQSALKLGEVVALMAAVVAIGAPWAVRMWVLMKMRMVMGRVLRLLVGKMSMMLVRVVVGSAICRGDGLDLRDGRTIDSSCAAQALLV